MARRTLVVGPAYIDRVLRVDRPLVDPADGPPIDLGGDGRWLPGPGLTLVDPTGASIAIHPPDGWPGPTGTVTLPRPFAEGSGCGRREVAGLAWADELGGMGAGYARALGGRLVHALGPEGDPVVSAILDRLAALGIDHRPIRVPGHLSDWTLLVTSGPFGDKLPIGFRGCHAALTPGDLPDDLLGPCDLRAVAALPNRLCERALRAPGAAVRLLAPAIRNAVDRDPPLASFADAVDLLTCNRREWERLDDRDEVARRVAVVAVTDGPDGARVMHRDLDGTPAEVYVDAFPRSRPPRDTNRAGEAFGSTLITALLDAGWIGGPVPAEVVSRAAARASAAAALVLDRLDFGFPEPAEVDVALRAGRVD